MHNTVYDRRGISLLEVLISIGILSVGLISVLSLIPAGRLLNSKANALDRTSLLAMNAAADFMNRGFARPTGWTNSNPGTAFVAYDPLLPASFQTFWSGTVTGALITPVRDAATSAVSTSMPSTVADLLVRSGDDIRYSTDGLGDDALPVPMWSISGTNGPHVFDGAYSYLATLSGATTTWNSGEYKTLTIVTFSRRDISSPPVRLTTSGTTADRPWTVDQQNVPSGSSLKDLVKPGSMVLFQPSAGPPSWLRVSLASDMTAVSSPATWVLGLTCEPPTPMTTGSVYLFPGAVGSTQLLIKLEGTSIWNDK
jgi:Tfp pilus assembly protein PilV